MTDQELDILLTERAKTLNLRTAAFETLDRVLSEHAADQDFLGGFQQSEIKAIFDRFEYHTDRRQGNSIIRTRIGLYVEDKNQTWLDNFELIGYYELETDLSGETVDDWLVIEKEKYLKDIDVISHFQIMNQKLPLEYLRRNYIQYEYVSYVSLVGTLFISKDFEGAGQFIKRAYTALEDLGDVRFDKDYLKASKTFLKASKECLLTNNLISGDLKQELIKG